MKKSILFIANPISGNKNIGYIIKKVKQNIDLNRFHYQFKITNYAGEARKIIKSEKNNFDAIIAIGGDGTLNEIAGELVNTNTVLGIIPNGSGNGLARTLHIPLNIKKAVQCINQFNFKQIDCGLINGHYFFNVSGVGYDAEIAHLFNQNNKRGFFSYLKLTLSHFLKYKPKSYLLKINGEELKKEAFLISFANSTQFGNNAHINPKGNLQDGSIECCILKKFPFYAAFGVVLKLLSKSLHKSKYFEFYSAKSFEIKYKGTIYGHIDGDSCEFNETVVIDTIQMGLKVIY